MTVARSYGQAGFGPTTAGARGATIMFGDAKGGVRYQWNGRAFIQRFSVEILRGFQNLARLAENYWRNEEWVPEKHPYMTGEERDLGFFIVSETNNRVTMIFGSRAPHAIFEEFGTVYREGHYPIRKTLDRYAYRASAVVRQAARAGGTL